MKGNDYQQVVVIFSMSIVLIVECSIGKNSLPTMTCIGVCIVLAAGIPVYADRGFQPYLILATNSHKFHRIIIIIPSLLRQLCRWTIIAIV